MPRPQKSKSAGLLLLFLAGAVLIAGQAIAAENPAAGLSGKERALAEIFAEMKSFPEFQRPALSEISGLKENSPVVKALASTPIELTGLRSLLPEKFKIATGKSIQPAVDSAILKIISTQAGQEGLCAFAHGTTADLFTFLSLSLPAAIKFQRICNQAKERPFTKHFLNVVKPNLKNSLPEFRSWPKQFVFIFSLSEELPGIEAYTDRRNVSYISINPRADETFLLRVIAHELAISYDSISRIGSLKTEAVGPKADELACALRDPAIRYGASAQRAFIFEDRVIDQLGLSEASPAVAATGSCEMIIAKNSVRMSGLAQVISSESVRQQQICGSMEKDPRARVRQVLAGIKKIAGFRSASLSEQIPEVSFCEYLLSPHLGPSPSGVFGGGPRPRMGGWDTSSNQNPSSIVNALEGIELADDEYKALGDALSFPSPESPFPNGEL